MGKDFKQKDVRVVNFIFVSSRKGGIKYVFFLYKLILECLSEIMKYFYDVLNQVNFFGCVVMLRKNVVNLLEYDNVLIKD